MLQSTKTSSQSWQALWNRFEKPITALFVTLGLATVGFSQTAALGVELPVKTEFLVNSANQQAIAPATVQRSGNQQLANGIYLFGQSPQPAQMGAAYMVFEVTQNRVVGAFYMPSSSFDCFRGEFQGNQMALNVVDSYERTVNPYSVAMTRATDVAQNGSTAAPVGFEGFHRINTLSALDRDILNTCRADFQQ